MKKLFLILVLLASVISIKAQGNLQFNQVRNIEITGSVLPGTPQMAYPITTIGSITVPQGKVWKIETTSAIVNSLDGYSVFVGPAVRVLIGNYLAYNPGEKEANYPIWLSSGNYSVRCIQTTYEDVIVSISAIEFNVIP